MRDSTRNKMDGMGSGEEGAAAAGEGGGVALVGTVCGIDGAVWPFVR